MTHDKQSFPPRARRRLAGGHLPAVAAVVGVLVLTACGGGDSGAAQPPGQQFDLDAAFGRLLANGGRFANLKWAGPGQEITTAVEYTPVPASSQAVPNSAVRTETWSSSPSAPPAVSQETWFFSLAPTRIHSVQAGTGLRRWIPATDLPAAGRVGDSGLYATVEGAVTNRITWSIEPADGATAWACLSDATDRAGRKECYRIDQAGAIHAAKLVTWGIGFERTYQ